MRTNVMNYPQSDQNQTHFRIELFGQKSAVPVRFTKVDNFQD